MGNKILVVDDDSKVRRALRLKLESMGYEVAEAWEAGGLVDTIKRHRPGVVLLDVQLTAPEGADALSEIVSFDPTLPVIMVMGGADVARGQRAIQRGAMDCIDEPLDFGRDELIVKINLALFRKKN